MVPRKPLARGKGFDNDDDRQTDETLHPHMTVVCNTDCERRTNAWQSVEQYLEVTIGGDEGCDDGWRRHCSGRRDASLCTERGYGRVMMNYLQGFDIPVVAFKEAWNVIDGDGDGAAPAGSIRCVDVLEGEIEETLRPDALAFYGYDWMGWKS